MEFCWQLYAAVFARQLSAIVQMQYAQHRVPHVEMEKCWVIVAAVLYVQEKRTKFAEADMIYSENVKLIFDVIMKELN